MRFIKGRQSVAALLLAGVFSGVGLRAATEDDLAKVLDQGEVRLPYGDLRKLWEAAQGGAKAGADEMLPVGTVLMSRFEVDLAEQKVAMTAEFKVESFSGKWECIKLMSADLPIASVEPAETRLVVLDDSIGVLAEKAGPLTIRIKFGEKPLRFAGETSLFKLDTAPTAVGSLSFKNVPAENRIKRVGEDDALSQGEAESIALPAKGGATEWMLAKASEEPKDEAPAPLLPSEWSLQNEVLVSQEESQLVYRVRAHLMATNGSAMDATLLLPGNARGIKVENAEDLLDWKPLRNREGLTELKLRWKTCDIMERDLRIDYAVQQLPLAQEWDLKAPALAAEEKTKSLYIVSASVGTEFKHADIQGPVPLARLSQWIKKETQSTEFGTVMGGSSVVLQSRVLPRLETAVAVITKSEYTTRIVGDGSVLTEATLEIEHNEALRWAFSLPEKSELLKCAVDDKTLRPIARENGLMEIPLEHSGGREIKSKVTFSYTSAKGKLAAVDGEVALELPQTPLFIQELLWSVELPEGYEISAAEGNVELTRSSTSAAKVNVVHLVKKLCRDERPQAQFIYQKIGLE